MWKRSFRARRPPKSEHWRCEKKAFVRDFRQNLKVEDVKMKLLCETSLINWKWKMGKRSFCARHPSKSDEDVKTKLSCETSFKIWKWKMWKRRFLARRPSIFESWSCENDMTPELLVPLRGRSDVKICRWKMRKPSFRARLPSKSKRWRCENDAFVRDVLQIFQSSS